MIQSFVLNGKSGHGQSIGRVANSITESRFVELSVPFSLIALVKVCSWTRLIQRPF